MDSLAEVPFFAGLDARTRKALDAAAERHDLKAGARVVEEGAPAVQLVVLLRGRAEARMREKLRPSVEHSVSELEPGEIIGEVSFFDRRPRSHSVCMQTDGVVLIVPFIALEQHPAVRDALALRLAARVRSAGIASLESERRRAALGELVVKVIVMLCCYALLLAGLPRLKTLPSSSSLISLPIIAVMGWGSWRFLRNTGYPRDEFGLGTRALLPSLLEATVLTPPFCALLVGVKWLVMQSHPLWRSLPLFEHPLWRERLLEPAVLKLLALYLASAVVQELTVRCALQAGLESFLLGAGRRWSAVLVAALMFSVNHLHMSFLVALLAFLPGVFWGWLFARRRNLAGPTLSHFITGGFVFFVLGIWLP